MKTKIDIPTQMAFGTHKLKVAFNMRELFNPTKKVVLINKFKNK